MPKTNCYNLTTGVGTIGMNTTGMGTSGLVSGGMSAEFGQMPKHITSDYTYSITNTQGALTNGYNTRDFLNNGTVNQTQPISASKHITKDSEAFSAASFNSKYLQHSQNNM